MELDFQRTRLERYEPVLDAVLTQEVTAESIVPDAFPDVSRVVFTFGEAYIAAKQVLGHSAKMMGSISLHVLYIPEGESIPKSLLLDLPFQCSSDFPQIGERDTVHGNVISVCAETRLLNPRKLFVKAEVKLKLHCYSNKSYEMIRDLAEEKPSIQVLREEHKCYPLLAALEKTFSFSDTLRQSPSKPAIEELLAYRVTPTGVDARYIGNKLICKGIVQLNGLYRSGDELVPMQYELPFSQILEFDGVFEEGDPIVTIALKNMECTLRDGELDVMVDAVIQATIRSQQAVTMLSDMYSTANPLDVQRTLIPLCTFSERGSSRQSVRKFCESGIPAKQILMSSVSMDPLSSKKTDGATQFSTDATVNLLYLSEDNALCGVSYTVPILCEIKVPQDCSCSCVCRPVSDVLAVPVTGGIEVRLEADFDWFVTRVESKPCVSSAQDGSIESSDTQPPSVIIRMVTKDESLWDIAKACRSTVRDICNANDLPSETVEWGTMLLIPTKRD